MHVMLCHLYLGVRVHVGSCITIIFGITKVTSQTQDGLRWGHRQSFVAVAVRWSSGAEEFSAWQNSTLVPYGERERGTLFPHCSFMLLPPGRRLQSSCSILRYLTAQDTGPLCAMCVCLFAVVVRTLLCRWPHPAAQALVCQVSTVHCMVYWCSSARSVWRMFRTPLRRLVWICLSHFLTTVNVVAILK